MDSDMAVPDNVISFSTGGFEINMNEMPVGKKYRFRFEGSRYVFWKDSGGNLVMREVGQE